MFRQCCRPWAQVASVVGYKIHPALHIWRSTLYNEEFIKFDVSLKQGDCLHSTTFIK
uniref:Uncharacterized protein n=1 Tax=Helianthus annuus TaxID=4232 RepID=A0A251UAS8_HELAN